MANSNRDNHNSIFEIMDGMMFQLSKTKKMFMIMILTTLIIPPIALLVMTSAYDSPFNDRFEQRLEDRLNEQLRRGQITLEEANKIKNQFINKQRNQVLFQPPQLVIFVISLVWLGVGIKQWISISKWDKKYQKFKEKQKQVDKKLDEYFDS
ncbi:MAG: hypothetical protein OEQ12_00585 [Nitrosopumilus sp.]|nr:hypothetical protein [Nitrosopumilus sp.]